MFVVNSRIEWWFCRSVIVNGRVILVISNREEFNVGVRCFDIVYSIFSRRKELGGCGFVGFRNVLRSL